MFQAYFAQHLGDLRVWPLLAMGLFIAVFAAQAFRILRVPRAEVERQARLPLEAETPESPHRSS